MVQEFHVLRCFSCQSFQVQQVKKVNRWSCKLCGEKQSLLKEFGRGSGADCRRHVQKLNAMRGALLEEQEQNTGSQREQEPTEGEDEPEENGDDPIQLSRWTKYVDTPEEEEPETHETDNILMDRQKHQGNNAMNRKRKRRDGLIDRQGRDSREPEQSNQLDEQVRSTGIINMNHSSAPSWRNTSHNRLNHISSPNQKDGCPPNKELTHPPSVRAGPESRWACFLSSTSQVAEEGEEPSVGQSQSSCSLPCYDITKDTPPLTRPRPLIPASSLFQSGDDFSFDEFEL